MMWIDKIKILEVSFLSGGGHRGGLKCFVNRAPTFHVDSIYYTECLVCTFVIFL